MWEVVLLMCMVSVVFTRRYPPSLRLFPLPPCLPPSHPLLSLSSCLSCSLSPKQLAMDLVHKGKAYIRGSGQKLTIVRAGLGASATVGGISGGAQE